MIISKSQTKWTLYIWFVVSLLLLITTYSLGWTMKKCIYAGKYMSVQDSTFGKQCILHNNTTSLALCSNITNMEADLSDVPTNIEVLCLSGTSKIIQGGNFVKFGQLVSLAIRMPISEISSEAFKGLENLQSLSLSFVGHAKCNNLSMPEDALINLHSLKFLSFQRYHLTQSTLIRLPHFTKLDMLSLSQNCLKNLFLIFHIFQGVYSIHTLNVVNNKIRRIEDTLIQNVTNITELNLSQNPLRSMKHGAFARLHLHLLNLDYTALSLRDLLTSGIKRLESLSFNHANNKVQFLCSAVARFQLKMLNIQVNKITAVHAKELSECHPLEIFNLKHNHLRTVDSDILSKLPKLKTLLLSYNYLRTVPCPERHNNSFISRLEHLQFSYNNLTVVKKRQFSCMPQLQKLFLKNNGIITIEPSAFWGLNHLRILDLSDNRLTELPSDFLSEMSNLNILYLKNNKLLSFIYQDFKPQTQLHDMDFGSVFVKFTAFDLFPSLQKLEFQNSGKYVHINAKSNFTSSLHTLFFNGRQLKLAVTCNHTFFTNLRVLKIYNNYHLESCEESGSPIQHFKNLETLQYHFNSKPFANKLNFSNMVNLINLDVQNLKTAIDRFKINPLDLFQKLYKLEIFKLVNSGIQYVTANLFKDMKSLRLLIIENGLIVKVDPGIQGLLSHASYVYLNDMTFQCDCANSWFVNWAIKEKKTFVSTVETAICLQLNKQFNLLTFVEKSCNETTGFVIFLVTFTSISVFLILTLMYTIFNSSILQLIYIFQVWLHKLRGKKCSPVKYDYDAFVSYCSLDQDWVIQYLIPNLEEKGPPFFKLCLHNRDFQVGKDIVENIMDSIYKSRKTICLISHSYLRSEWCSLEMRMATYKILEEKNDDLILLFLERISRHQLSSYHRLAKMVKKKTYIDWPKEEYEQIAFWEKLKLTIMDAKPEQEME